LTLGEEVKSVDALTDLRRELHEPESLGRLDEDDLKAFILLSLGDDVLGDVRCATCSWVENVDLQSRGE